MSFKRFIPIFVLAILAAAAVVSQAGAGGIRDWEPCPDNGSDLLCPAGAVGTPYSIKFRAVEEPPCQPGEDFWHIVNDSPPPGLTLASDGTLSGTPTAAGSYSFWVEMQLPQNDHCNGGADTTQERFTVPINPGTPAPPPLPRLIIGPESVAAATVGTPYSAAMTANLPDAKTWSIASGTLPPGINLGAANGLISGTPTAAGSYTFTVLAVLDATRSDRKTLTINVRDPLAIAASGALVTRTARTEVGVAFDAAVAATGGFGSYVWSVAGVLPPGLELGTDGTITGVPAEAGSYRFTLSVLDGEGRRAAFAAKVVVAERLAIASKLLRPGIVGRFFSRKVATVGGVNPTTTRVKRGPLPKGVFFDRTTGLFAGTPRRAGTWRILVEIVDALGVKAKGTLVLVVRDGT